jgi:hypothetical protein
MRLRSGSSYSDRVAGAADAVLSGPRTDEVFHECVIPVRLHPRLICDAGPIDSHPTKDGRQMPANATWLLTNPIRCSFSPLDCRQPRPWAILGDRATTRTRHSARTATCGSMNFNVSLAVERAAHVDVPPLKPVLVAEIAGDTQKLAAWGDHVPVVRVAPYLFGLGGAQRLSHASEGYPRWPGESVHRLSPTTVKEEPTTNGRPMRRRSTRGPPIAK